MGCLDCFGSSSSRKRRGAALRERGAQQGLDTLHDRLIVENPYYSEPSGVDPVAALRQNIGGSCGGSRPEEGPGQHQERLRAKLALVERAQALRAAQARQLGEAGVRSRAEACLERCWGGERRLLPALQQLLECRPADLGEDPAGQPLAQQGPLCSVRSAVHRQLGPVAVKQGPWRSLAGDLLCLHQLRHPHIVSLLAWVPVEGAAEGEEGEVAIVLERAACSLTEAVCEAHRAGAAFTQAQLCAMAQQLTAALACVHEAGYLHLDLKPHNVLVLGRCPQGTPCLELCDFGAARHLGDSAQRRLSIGHGVGTSLYADPLLARPPHMASAASDIFSLGCTLLSATTCEAPGVGPAERAAQLAKAGASEEWATLVEACLHARAFQRPTLPALQAELAAIAPRQ